MFSTQSFTAKDKFNMLILRTQGHSDTAIGAKYGASQRTVAHQLKQAERDIMRLLLVVAPVVKQCLDNYRGRGSRNHFR